MTAERLSSGLEAARFSLQRVTDVSNRVSRQLVQGSVEAALVFAARAKRLELRLSSKSVVLASPQGSAKRLATERVLGCRVKAAEDQGAVETQEEAVATEEMTLTAASHHPPMTPI